MRRACSVAGPTLTVPTPYKIKKVTCQQGCTMPWATALQTEDPAGQNQHQQCVCVHTRHARATSRIGYKHVQLSRAVAHRPINLLRCQHPSACTGCAEHSTTSSSLHSGTHIPYAAPQTLSIQCNSRSHQSDNGCPKADELHSSRASLSAACWPQGPRPVTPSHNSAGSTASGAHTVTTAGHMPNSRYSSCHELRLITWHDNASTLHVLPHAKL